LTKIAEGHGYAPAASPRRSRSAFARDLAQAVERALHRAQTEGITDPIEIQARINSARVLVRRRHASPPRSRV